MTEPDPLLVEYPSDDIVVLRLNRPQVRNALNLTVRQRLADEVTRHAADPAIRCLVITGSDKAFAAGADIKEMADAGPVEVMARNVQKYWRILMDCPKPLIAAVEGFALGGGLELALCADIIVAGEGAKLGLPEVKIGILPGGGGTQKLARLVGRQRAMLLLMTGTHLRRGRSARHGRRQRGRAHRPGAGPRARNRARDRGHAADLRSCRSRKSSMPA